MALMLGLLCHRSMDLADMVRLVAESKVGLFNEMTRPVLRRVIFK